MYYSLYLGKHVSMKERHIWVQGTLRRALSISFHQICFYIYMFWHPRIINMFYKLNVLVCWRRPKITSKHNSQNNACTWGSRPLFLEAPSQVSEALFTVHHSYDRVTKNNNEEGYSYIFFLPYKNLIVTFQQYEVHLRNRRGN